MVTDSSTLMNNNPVLMLAPLPWQSTLGLPLGTWYFPTESSIHPLEQVHDLSLDLQVHNSCFASSCLHLSLLAHRTETNSIKAKEICHRSLGYTSQAQNVNLLCSMLLSSSLILLSDSSTLTSFLLCAGLTSTGQSFPLYQYWVGSRSLGAYCLVGLVQCLCHLWHCDRSRLVRSPSIIRKLVSQEAKGQVTWFSDSWSGGQGQSYLLGGKFYLERSHDCWLTDTTRSLHLFYISFESPQPRHSIYSVCPFLEHLQSLASSR